MHIGWWRRRWTPVARRTPAWVSLELLRRAELADARRQPSPRGSLVRDFHFGKLNYMRSLPVDNRSLHALLGVELRYPFFDRRLVEWSLMVPPFRWGEEGRLKTPMRRALADLLPPAILQRGDKGNYLHYWDLGARDKERARIEQLLERPLAAEGGFVDAARLRRAYQAYCAGGPIDRRRFWNAIQLEQWLRTSPLVER
jgi:asparagine synthase (glutamine-hydrolysing)